MVIDDLTISIGLFILGALGISTSLSLFKDTQNKNSIQTAYVFMYLGVMSGILGIILILYSVRV